MFFLFLCFCLIQSALILLDQAEEDKWLYKPVPIFIFPQAGDYEMERLGIQRLQIPLQQKRPSRIYWEKVKWKTKSISLIILISL